MHNKEWVDVLTRVRPHIPALASRFVARLAGLTGYRDSLPEAELARAAETSLVLLLDALTDPVRVAALSEHARDIGRDRARRGVPVEDLVAAVRMDAPLLWEAIVAEAAVGERAALVERVAQVWGAVDEYAAACYSAYVDERVAWARTDAEARSRAVAALFEPRGAGRAEVERAIRVAGVPRAARYAVAAVVGERAAAQAGEGGVTLHVADGMSLALWPVIDDETQRPEPPLALREGPGAVVLTTGGLETVGVATLSARALAIHARDGEMLTFERHWPRLVRSALPAGLDPALIIERRLAAVRPAERERLRATVLHHLETGSVSTTAARTFTHRNTVLNRLRRFTELTHLRLDVPIDAALVVAAWGGEPDGAVG